MKKSKLFHISFENRFCLAEKGVDNLEGLGENDTGAHPPACIDHGHEFGVRRETASLY